MAASESRAPSAATGSGAAVAVNGIVRVPHVFQGHDAKIGWDVSGTLHVACALAAITLSKPRKTAKVDMPDLNDDVLRLIGSFVPWAAPDYASRARMVCRAIRNGVDDAAKSQALPSMYIPYVIANKSFWRKAMYSKFGLCCMCNACPPHMMFCESSRYCEQQKAICRPCHDKTEQLNACTSCVQCGKWYCNGHYRRNRIICVECSAVCCSNCVSSYESLCKSCEEFADMITYSSVSISDEDEE
jgi:hypothetical protein